MFHSYFERKNDKVLAFNIIHFPNFEISASLITPAWGAYKRKCSTIVLPKLETNKPQKNQSYPEVNFIKKQLWHRCFPMNFIKFLRILLYTEHLWWLFLLQEHVKHGINRILTQK